MNLFKPSRWKFNWRYFRGETPWDTNITPPEVMEFIFQIPPGKALDLGCGTGTNAITLARHGWEVTGVDFAQRAIRIARQKASTEGLKIEFHVADVTDLGFLKDKYDYALDIGCLFTLKEKERSRYALGLYRLVRPEGWYMLYAWLPSEWKKGRSWGISQEEVEALLGKEFNRVRMVLGEERGRSSAWYWYQKRG